MEVSVPPLDLTAKVSLTISCLNLPSLDLLSKSDPYCVVLIFDARNKSWTPIGRSETIGNTSNPTFVKDFILTYNFEQEQIFLVKVFDDDYGKKPDDFIGEVTFKLGTLMGKRGQVLVLDLPTSKRAPGGKISKIILRGDSVASEANNVLHFRLEGRNLDRKDGFLFKSDPYFELSVQRSSGEYVIVHRSEYVFQNLNPKWKPSSIPMSRLKAGAVRLTVTDWDRDGKHDLIGVADITVNDLLQRKKDIALIHPPTKAKYTAAKKYVNSGFVDVMECTLVRNFSFTEYLRGGLEIQLMLAIDFTASNRDHRLKESLHFGAAEHGISNAYKEAISKVGSICLEYDSDKLVQAFGFGAKLANTQVVNHCFPLSLAQEQVAGVEGVLDAYGKLFRTGMELFGPTHFAPVIQRCTTLAMQNSDAYSVLLIITDGEILDMDATIDAICFAAANAPLSLIIVGVGSSSFESMEHLDGDVHPLVDSQRRACARDIVQFVPFSRFKNSGDLASETLKELPDQVTAYFRRLNRPPNPPIEIPLGTLIAAGEDVPVAQEVTHLH